MRGDFIMVRLKTGMSKTLKSARRPEVGNIGKWQEFKVVNWYAISALQGQIAHPKQNGMSLIFYIFILNPENTFFMISSN